MARQKTGIVELDTMLHGGFLERDAVMVAGSAGTGKTTLSLQHLVNGITKFGEPGIGVAAAMGARRDCRRWSSHQRRLTKVV